MQCTKQFRRILVASLPPVCGKRFYSIPKVPHRNTNQPLHDVMFKFPNSVEVYGLLHRTTLTWKEVKHWMKCRKMDRMREDQKFLSKRHKFLGPDLATAQFITFRGGKIKFKDNEEWLEKKHIKSREIPSKFVSGLFVEAIDASGTSLMYEGFDNFVDLKYLKKVILRDCPYIDDFCLQRLHMVEDTLEYLDISGCSNVTERGLCTLHKLRHLKELTIHNNPGIYNKELTCLMLQDVLPQCKIHGVDYEDVGLWDSLRNYLDVEEETKMVSSAKMQLKA